MDDASTGSSTSSAGPVSLAPTADGTLHVGAATAPTNDWADPGQYVVARAIGGRRHAGAA